MKKQDDLVLFGDYFEWQKSKAEENIRKHKIAFEEAAEVFFFSETQYYIDSFHSFDELRYFAVGFTSEGKLLVVRYTERTRFHIISAWKANSSERKDYEEKRNEFKEHGF
jgi:uncharacterized DUF497 family protein